MTAGVVSSVSSCHKPGFFLISEQKTVPGLSHAQLKQVPKHDCPACPAAPDGQSRPFFSYVSSKYQPISALVSFIDDHASISNRLTLDQGPRVRSTHT